MDVKYCVITEITSLAGNLATTVDVYHATEEPSAANDYVGRYDLVDPRISLALRHPVFHVGEVLITDSDTREYAYPGRKPRKWDVKYELFDDVEAALERAQAVYEESLT